MKLRLAVWGIFLALCVTPAFADSVHLSNKGMISGGGSDSGISIVSCLTKISFDGSVLFSGHLGTIAFDTGNFTGSLLGGGVFNGGTFDIDVSGFGTALFANNFTGSWTKISDELYKLVGTFSATVDGLHINGTTTQFFELEKEDGHLSFDDVHGKTCLSPSPSPVPEPGTLTLLGTGLLSLGGFVRRKLAVN
jgi:PEP-CTERM motif